MKISHYTEVQAKPVEVEGAREVTVRWLLSESDGAPNFAMRLFESAPGGHTPRHHHPFEHEAFVLEGTGTVLEGDAERPLKAGDVVLVDPDEVHQFRNTGEAPMKMLCLVPAVACS